MSWTIMGAVAYDGGIGISEDHVALRDTARRWTTAHVPSSVPRAALETDDEALPPFWGELAGLGWLGLHLPADVGGEGYGLGELAVVLEELGRVCAPGPFLPSVLAAAAIDRYGTHELRRELLPDLAGGRRVGTVAVGCTPVPSWTRDPAPEGRGSRPEPGRGTELVVDGTWEAVLSGGVADVLVLPATPAGDSGATAWVVVDGSDVHVEPLASVDRTRRVARVTARDLTVPTPRVLRPPGDPVPSVEPVTDLPAIRGRSIASSRGGDATVEHLAAVLFAAESVGVAAWCVDTAAEHAVVREQFGRPIGQFQGVKHRCADMLCALERARAAAWDATRGGPGAEAALVAAVAGSLAPEAAYTCAKDAIQVLGGIGFTWEHDAHLYLKRAMSTRALLGGPDPWRVEVATRAATGTRRAAAIELPSEAEPIRAEVRAFVEDLQARDKATWDRHLADAGYLVPHWPRPWGRDASPLEQVVIDQELRAARVRRRHLAVGAWALPTIIVHGSPAQQERFVPATLRGELTWCQMFSEPGAGSDLASLSTKAVRTDGGWLLTGQKVWTSLAQMADWGICLARTDPAASRHDGIGCFLVDMRSDGLDIRPLRELTGAEMFNEVFLSDVFVPDDCVVGGPTDGWRAARTTLANERVSMGSGASMGPSVEAVVDLAAPQLDDPLVAVTVGDVVAGTVALAAMGARMTLRALSGAAPGPEASVRKLLGVELDQRVQEVGLELLGAGAATGDGAAAGWIGGFLGNRSLSIAGGTSEIQRNVIAERLLGLPRDP